MKLTKKKIFKDCNNFNYTKKNINKKQAYYNFEENLNIEFKKKQIK